MDLLAHTLEATKLEFLDSGIRSIPDDSPSVTHSMELELPQGAGSWAALGGSSSHSSAILLTYSGCYLWYLKKIFGRLNEYTLG